VNPTWVNKNKENRHNPPLTGAYFYHRVRRNGPEAC